MTPDHAMLPGTMDAAEYKVLYEASDETFLIHLASPSFIGKPDGAREADQPAMSIETLRPALRRLLCEGLIQMYEVTDNDRDLILEEALTVIDQDTHWVAPSEDEEPMTVIYGLITTPSGDDELAREHRSR